MCLRFLLLLSIPLLVESYPGGPPKSVCDDGLPVHLKGGKPVPPQNGTSPYIIDVNSTSIRPGETVRVKIHSNMGEMFRGLFLQVHPLQNKTESIKYVAVGLFDRKITNIKLMTCRIMLDTLSHEDSFMKVEASFDWRAPLYLKHDVVIRATILKNFDTYWHNVESNRITVVKNETLPVEMLKKPWIEEIIKTVKNEDNPEIRQKLVKARFERGFRNTIDPNGFVMINYITNLLPFEDSPVPIKVVSSETINGTVGPLEDSISENMDRNNTDLQPDLPTNIKDRDEENNTLAENLTTQNESLTVSKQPENDSKSDSTVGEELSNTTDDQAILDINKLKKSSMMEKYYDVLVRSLLKGDKLVADTLNDIMQST